MVSRPGGAEREAMKTPKEGDWVRYLGHKNSDSLGIVVGINTDSHGFASADVKAGPSRFRLYADDILEVRSQEGA